MRHSDDHFTLITAVAQWHDFDWLNASLPEGLTLEDHTDDYSTLIVSGPQSRDLMAEICDGDLQAPWLSHMSCHVAGKPALIARVSFAGELGWEVHHLIKQLKSMRQS